MISTKGEPGTGDVVQAVRHMRMMQSEIQQNRIYGKRRTFRSCKAVTGSV